MDLAGRKGTVELAIPILFSLPYITILWFKDVGFFLCYLLLGRARMGTDFRISHFEFGFLLYVNRFGERYVKREGNRPWGTCELCSTGLNVKVQPPVPGHRERSHVVPARQALPLSG